MSRLFLTTALLFSACGYGVVITTPPPGVASPTAAIAGTTGTAPPGECSAASVRASDALHYSGQTVAVCFRIADAKAIGQTTKILYSTKPQRPDDFMVVVFPFDATLAAIVTPPDRLIGVRIEVRGEVAADNPSLPPQMIVTEAVQLRVLGR